MTEDIFCDGSAGFSDDFSLASGIDEINYDDPFNSNHNKYVGLDIRSKKHHSLTIQDSTSNTKNQGIFNLKKGYPKIAGEKSNLSEQNFCLFETSSDKVNTIQSTDHCNQYPSSLPSCKQNTIISKCNPQKMQIVENIRRSVMNTRGKKKKQSNYSTLKPEIVAVKAQKMSIRNTLKPSKSDGLLTLTLKAKYRNTTAQHVAARNITVTSSNVGCSSPHMSAVGEVGNSSESDVGNANASWYRGSGSQNKLKKNFIDGPDNRIYSVPPVKSSNMHDLLLQSKAQCRSQFLLRQSSAHSLSKRNSFQSIKYAIEKVDVSSLLPAKRYTNSRSASRRWSFPNVASTTSKSEHTMNSKRVGEDQVQTSDNDGIGNMTDSLLHEACRLFPNSDAVVETALRVDPDAIRRSVVFTNDHDGDSHQKTNSSKYGYPINLALTHGANEKILKLLAQSGSDVLALKDGTNGGASLGIALASKQCNLVIVDLLLTANKMCARISDRRGNYPLHVAVSYGISVDIVMRLYAAYPEAQGMRNFHSQTPLDIAIQSTRCPEEVIDFLRSVPCRISCADYTNIDTKRIDSNQSFGFLEDGLDDIMQTNCL